MFIAALVAAAGSAQAQWSDNFNRPNGAIGGDWTVVSGTWGIVSNQGVHQSANPNEYIRHNTAALSYDLSVTGLDVFAISTASQFSGVLIGLGGTDAILVKLQAQTATGQFSNIGFYRLSTTAAWTGTTTLPGGATNTAGFIAIPAGLTFASGRMTVSFPTADLLQLDIDTDFNGSTDQTYTRSGVSTISAGFGTSHGIVGWGTTATFDNWLVGTAGPSGACCITATGACITSTQAGCTSSGGVYQGNGVSCGSVQCPQPPTGACCLDTGCAVVTQAQCTAQGGVYQGNSSACATANCPPATAWVEQGDAGDLPGTAQITTGPSTLTAIRGALTAGDVDMYKINICDAPNFTAIGSGTVSDTQMFLFDSTGKGVAMNDDTPVGTGLQSALAPAGAIPGLTNGSYYLALSSYDNDPNDASAQALWLDTPFNTVRAPDGPGAANPVASWDGAGSNTGTYSIALTGACFGQSAGASCYANCDNTTNAPCLNVNDFVCFNNAYSAGSPYANCDASTIAPILNVNDFVCFNNAYSAGCANPCSPHP
jgi:hypothetical protein